MKIFRLTYNEFVKQFKKTSIKAIFLSILILAIAIPMVVGNIDFKPLYNQFNEESVKSNILYIEEDIKAIENSNAQKDKIARKYLQIDKEYNEILLENEIGYDDWQREEADEYRDTSYKLANIEFVLEAYEKDLILQNLRAQDPTEIQAYYKLKKDKKKEIEAQYTKEKEYLLNVIKTNDYQAHTNLKIERKNNYIAIEEKAIKEYEDLKAKNPTSKAKIAELKKLEERKDLALKSIQHYKEDLILLEFRLKEDIDYSNSNWKNEAILKIQEILDEYRRELLTEEKYNLDYDQSLSTSYEDYVAKYEEANRMRVEKMNELWYSLENNIPQLGAIKDTRSVIDSTYEVFVILAVVMAIIIGGSIVSNEFSTGSIRLLLIRPVSRWKILLSKLISVLIVGYSIIILGTAILVITSGVTLGFDALQIPVLQTVNNEIIQVPYFEYMIPQLLTSSASLIFITSLVFMVSTISKNTALAVATGMLAYIGIAPLTQMLINMKQVWLLDTLLPYINSSFFKLMPDMTQILNESGLVMNYQLGASQLLIASVVFLLITFVIFVKRDVKN